MSDHDHDHDHDHDQRAASRELERFIRWPSRHNAESAWGAARRIKGNHQQNEEFRQREVPIADIVVCLNHYRGGILLLLSGALALLCFATSLIRQQYPTMGFWFHVVYLSIGAALVVVGAVWWLVAGLRIRQLAHRERDSFGGLRGHSRTP